MRMIKIMDYDGGPGLSSVDNPPSPVEGSFNRSCKVSSGLSQEQMTDRLKLILVLIVSFPAALI
jgi:hypothetical protein